MIKFWKKWLDINRKLISIPANIILTLIYFLLMLPLALFLKAFAPQALLGHGHQKKDHSYWIKREKVKPTLEWAREQ